MTNTTFRELTSEEIKSVTGGACTRTGTNNGEEACDTGYPGSPTGGDGNDQFDGSHPFFRP